MSPIGGLWGKWVWVWVGWDDSQYSNLQTEFKYLGLLKFYHVWTDLGIPHGGGWVWVWVVGGVSTKLKSSNRIEISWFINFLLTFDWFQGPPLGGGTLSGCLGCASHVHTHMHAHISDDVITGFPREFPMPWEQPFAWNYDVYTWMHMHACACTCVWGTTQTPWQSPTPIPPKGGPPEISQKSIKIEWIKIFEFCLKILDLWTLVHSNRLHLVCRCRGVSYYK